MWLKISNQGLIDPNALILMGASSKRDDSTKIGFFGTGIKYALAVLLRNNIEVRIYNGIKEIDITTKTVSFRDKEYQQVFIDGRETSITTDIGPDWKIWYAIREIYCNALDEGGMDIAQVSNIASHLNESETTIFIDVTEDIQDILRNWDLYFSNIREVLYESKHGKIFQGDGTTRIYRKGILVHENKDRKALFHYDFLEIDINESRTIRWTSDIRCMLSQMIPECNNIDIVRRFLDSFQIIDRSNTLLEHELYWNYSVFSPIFHDLLKTLQLVPSESTGFYQEEIKKHPSICLPYEFIEQLRKNFPTLKIVGITSKGIQYKILEKTEKQRLMIVDSIKFLELGGYTIDYPVEVVDLQNKDILGTIGDGSLLIAKETFDKGKKFVIETLFEEWVHQKYGYHDCCRDMQNYLFNQLMTLLEEKTKIYL